MLIELLACVGLHWILKYGTILNYPRELMCKIPLIAKLFKCSLCLGFWCGLMIAIYNSRDLVLYPLAGAGLCWLLDCIINVLQSVEIKLDNE